MTELGTLKRLLSGGLGLHLIRNPMGTYMFVGSVPVALHNQVWKTEAEAWEAAKQLEQ